MAPTVSAGAASLCRAPKLITEATHMNQHVLENMRGRAQQARRLADLTHGPGVSQQLREMAAQIEADIERLNEENGSVA